MTHFTAHTLWLSPAVLKASVMDESRTNDSFEMNQFKGADKPGSQAPSTTNTTNMDEWFRMNQLTREELFYLRI